VLQCVAVCYSVLHCVTLLFCSFHRVAVCSPARIQSEVANLHWVLQFVAVCVAVYVALMYIAARRMQGEASILQCVLQCCGVCCSVCCSVAVCVAVCAAVCVAVLQRVLQRVLQCVLQSPA